MKHLTPYLIKANAFLEEEWDAWQAWNQRASDTEGQKEKWPAKGFFNEKGEIQGEFTGFISAFAPAVIRSGLMPAIFLYAEKSGAGKSKIPLNRLLLHIIKEEDAMEDNLKSYVLNRSGGSTYRLEQQLIQASIAAKLALRTFPVSEKNKDS